MTIDMFFSSVLLNAFRNPGDEAFQRKMLEETYDFVRRLERGGKDCESLAPEDRVGETPIFNRIVRMVTETEKQDQYLKQQSFNRDGHKNKSSPSSLNTKLTTSFRPNWSKSNIESAAMSEEQAHAATGSSNDQRTKPAL